MGSGKMGKMKGTLHVVTFFLLLFLTNPVFSGDKFLVKTEADNETGASEDHYILEMETEENDDVYQSAYHPSYKTTRKHRPSHRTTTTHGHTTTQRHLPSPIPPTTSKNRPSTSGNGPNHEDRLPNHHQFKPFKHHHNKRPIISGKGPNNEDKLPHHHQFKPRKHHHNN